eukprot:2238860-Alexandrium_andersonii.AAC.1
MRHEGLPPRSLREVLLPVGHCLRVREDNQSMMAIAKSGRSPAARYLRRTHRVSVPWLHERFSEIQAAPVEIKYEDSADMMADIY